MRGVRRSAFLAIAGLTAASAGALAAYACSPFDATEQPTASDASASDAGAGDGATDASSDVGACDPGAPLACDGAIACIDFEDQPPAVLADGLLGPFVDIANSRDTNVLLEIADGGGVGCGRGLHAVVSGDAGGEKRAEIDLNANPPPAELTIEARVRVISAATECRLVDVEYELPDAGTGRIFAVATGAAGIQLDSDGFGFNGSGQVGRTGGYQRLVLVVPFGKVPSLRVDDGSLLTATTITPVRPGSTRIKVFFGPKTQQAPCEMWIDRIVIR